MLKTSRILALLLGFGLISGQAHGGLSTFGGEDLQPTGTPGAHPNADSAAASFRTAALAVGPVGTITFESSPLGSFSSLTVAPGVNITGTDVNGSNQTIRNSSNFPSFPSVDGSNTTPGGSQFVEMIGGTLTFTFATPTQFFGAYLTGVQTNFFQDSVNFSDGTTQSIFLVGAGTSQFNGEIAFIGFVDPGKLISSITINAGNSGFDDIGVDDVSFLQPAVVPEPSSLTLCALASLTTACWHVRSRRRSRA
jgi:hypothetical protein